MSIQKAIQLNNQVVPLLERKLFNDAIMYSCAALEMFQQHQYTAVQQVSVQSDNESIDHFLLDHHEHTKSSDDDTMNEFIYEHGIVLPTDRGMHPISIITPVFIFNCALSYHLLASHCNDDDISRNYLERAGDLYQLAFEQGNGRAVKHTIIFQFVIVNNIGVIHKRLDDHKASSKCFEHLVSLMMVLVDVGAENKCIQHLQGFWKNVLENGSMAPAA